jgi:hypothetical protein
MTQIALAFTEPRSLVDRLEAFMRAREGVWIDGRELAKVAGAYAWRTRVSDLRKRGYQVANRKRHVAYAGGSHYTISEYRLTLV